MRKKIIVTVVLLFMGGLVALSAWRLTDRATVYVDGKSTALSAEDSWRFRKALKKDFKDSTGGFGCFTNYGCGFSEDFSIHMGGLTYCFGQDDCSSIYVSELDYYYAVSDENHEEIHRLVAEVTKQPKG